MKQLIQSLFVSFFALTLITSCNGTSSKLGLGPGDPEDNYGTTIGSRNPASGVFPESEYAPRGLKLKTIRAVLQFVVNNISKTKAIIKKYVDKEAAEVYIKYFGELEKVIEKILEHTGLNIDFVYDQIVGGLMALNVPRPAATIIAQGIKICIQVLL